MDRELFEGEWSRFCELVQALPEELKKVLGKFGQKRGNPTRKTTESSEGGGEKE